MTQRPRKSVSGSRKKRRRSVAPAPPVELIGDGAKSSTLRSNLVFPLLRQPRTVVDGELTIVLHQPDRRQRRYPFGGSDVVAHRIGMAELSFDRLGFFAEQEINELFSAL